MKRNEVGAIAGVEGLAMGVLIFVFGSLVAISAWGVIDARLAVSAAAREGARVYVEAGDAASAFTSARDVAAEALRGHNRAVATFTVAPRSGGPGFRRCGSVLVTVATEVPRAPLPLLRRAGGTYTVRATHTEVVDPYRSGLGGIAQC